LKRANPRAEKSKRTAPRKLEKRGTRVQHKLPQPHFLSKVKVEGLKVALVLKSLSLFLKSLSLVAKVIRLFSFFQNCKYPKISFTKIQIVTFFSLKADIRHNLANTVGAAATMTKAFGALVKVIYDFVVSDLSPAARRLNIIYASFLSIEIFLCFVISLIDVDVEPNPRRFRFLSFFL
jgi:hypothetical protein